jgi:hypothetical protein
LKFHSRNLVRMEYWFHSLRLSSLYVAAVTGKVCIFQLAGEVGVEPIDTTAKKRGARPFILASWQNPSFFLRKIIYVKVGDLTPFSAWSVTSTLSYQLSTIDCPFLERNPVHDILQKGNRKTVLVSG